VTTTRFEPVDLSQPGDIVSTTLRHLATSAGTTLQPDKLPGFSYTMTYDLTGWPAGVVRAGTSPEGLPIGVQVVAQPWREDVALALARRIEKALGASSMPAIPPVVRGR
jgi:amidase